MSLANYLSVIPQSVPYFLISDDFHASLSRFSLHKHMEVVCHPSLASWDFMVVFHSSSYSHLRIQCWRCFLLLQCISFHARPQCHKRQSSFTSVPQSFARAHSIWLFKNSEDWPGVAFYTSILNLSWSSALEMILHKLN